MVILDVGTEPGVGGQSRGSLGMALGEPWQRQPLAQEASPRPEC